MHPNDTTTSVEFQLVGDHVAQHDLDELLEQDYEHDVEGVDAMTWERGQTVGYLYAKPGAGPQDPWYIEQEEGTVPQLFGASEEDLYLRYGPDGLYDAISGFGIEHLLNFGWLVLPLPHTGHASRSPFDYAWDADTICTCSFCQTSPYHLRHQEAV